MASMSDPKAPSMPEGWTVTYPGEQWQYFEHAKRELVVTADRDGIECAHEGGTSFIPLPVLQALLSAHGLAIVSEADRKVLEFMSDVNQRWLESYVNIIAPTQADPQVFAWAVAELEARKTREK